MQTKTVRVTRAFYFSKAPTKVGQVLDLPHVFALEMIAAHKAEPAEKQSATSESTSDKAKGAKDAR